MTVDANRVELYRVEPALGDILVGEGVRGATAEATARLYHWVRGRGKCIIPAHHPRYTIAAAASSTLRYYMSVSEAAITRVWLLDVRASSKTADCFFTVQAGAGATSDTYRRTGRSAQSLPVLYIETGSSQDPTPAEISVVIACISGTARVESVACYELPRAALARDAGPDYGVALDSYYPREDVYQQATSGLYGLAGGIVTLETRRIGHVSMWHDTGIDTTSAAFVDITAVGQRIVPALDRSADTTRLLEGYVWAYCSDGTTAGEFRLKRADATTSTAVAIPAGTVAGAWFGPTELAFSCEDLSKTDGVRGGSYETCTFQIRRTAGAGTFKVKGYNAFEKFV